jgi:hypothetical protein
MGHERVAVLGIEVQQDLAIAPGLEAIAFRDEPGTELAEVVDLTVTDEAEGPVFVRKGLMAAFDIDDGETAHSEHGAWVEVEAVVVRTPMSDGRGHPAQRLAVGQHSW